MKTKLYFKEIFAKNEKHNPVIDGIRAISVLSIIAFHVLVGIIQVIDNARAQQFILNMPTFLQPLWHGEKGVDAFFLLSGLVIGIPLFKSIERFDFKAAGVFLKKKLYRIYPLFLVALLLYTAGQWSHFGKYFLSNLVFLNNLIPGERTIIPVGWFLTVEVQYFALVPLLFLLLKKMKHRGLALSAVFFASIVASSGILIEHPDLYLRPITDLFLAADKGQFSTKMGQFFYESNLARFGPFVAGILLSYIMTFYPDKIAELLNNKAANLLAFLSCGALIALPILMPLYDPTSWFYQPFSANRNFIYLAISRQAFALGIALLVLGCSNAAGFFKLPAKLLQWRAWQPISKLSFPIYLFHFPFIAIAAISVFGTIDMKQITTVGVGEGILIFLLAAVLTFIFSIPLYIYVERPFIERGRNRTN